MPGARADGSIPTRSQKGKARAILNRLKARYPTISTALDYASPWQLLVTTVLSAQTTDENVNRVRAPLFARYPEPADLAAADMEEVEQIIYSTGFYRQKAKSIVTLAGDVIDKFGGVVPRDLDALTTLRGVGRKTASVVLAEAWGDPAIAVDTHVRRVTNRLGLTRQADPVKIEADLKALYPVADWSGVSMRFIQFGRDICIARTPLCRECELVTLCDWPDKRL